MTDKPTKLSEMSETEKDRHVLKLEQRIAHLEGKLAAIRPDEAARAKWTHEKLVELMAPFSDLRNTMTLVNQMQHCLNQQSLMEGEMRAMKLMLGAEVAEDMALEADAHLIASLEAAGKSDHEIETILHQMGKI